MDEFFEKSKEPEHETAIDPFAATVRAFEQRIEARNFSHELGVPCEDWDIMHAAEKAGLNPDLIHAACLMARQRISAQTSIDLVNVDSRVIALLWKNRRTEEDTN